ncbi:MAG TPA: glycogen synthase GlgA [Syntrophales bacterium]|nr:glycogen synthase GlgA [Syntrophobacterales bacterium]HQL90416.1 glycogen synthase GlgA [Syntrophales bacterium]
MDGKAMRVLMVSAEMAPFAKEGGLGDALLGLSRALARLGHDVRAVLPCYAAIDADLYDLRYRLSMDVPMGVLGRLPVEVLEEQVPGSGVTAYFVRYDPYYARRGLYGHDGEGYTDNGRRFILLSRAALELSAALGLEPDVVHVHDWHAAAVPVFLDTLYRTGHGGRSPASLLTIHNMLQQGVFDKGLMEVLDVGWEHFHFRDLEFFDRVNLLKGGIAHATLINTVSPTYAREIRSPEFAYGIEGVLAERAADLSGILNGADYDEWNPETDPLIASAFSAGDLRGKALCKGDLQRSLGLPVKAGVPLFGFVSRLVKQKGIDLLAEAMESILGLDVQVALLGSGEPWAHPYFGRMAQTHPAKLSCRFGFDNGLAHKIMAGADFFVMPSRFEPCGLTQMYAMRYGTLPVVRATGGLNDTVENFDEATLEGTGFRFYDATARALSDTIGWAAHTFTNRPEAVRALVKRAMAKRFTWEAAAERYENLYVEAVIRGCEDRRRSAP